MYNAFAIVIPCLLEYKSDIGNDIQSVSSKKLAISNQKNRYKRFIKNIWQSASIGAGLNCPYNYEFICPFQLLNHIMQNNYCFVQAKFLTALFEQNVVLKERKCCNKILKILKESSVRISESSKYEY